MKRIINLILTALIFISISTQPLLAEIEIEKIDFVRNKHFKDRELREIIHSEKGATFEPRLLKLDKILLTNYYKQHGFLNIEIADSVTTISEREKVKIIYFVDEGQRFYYGGIRLKGNVEIVSLKISEMFSGLELYNPFDEGQVNQAVKKVEDLYYNSGKPFVRMNVNYLIEEDSLLMILLDIQENQTVYINDIEYYGLKLVQKFLIRRELEIKKGEIYNRQAIEKSQENLYGTGLFKYVRLEIEPIVDRSDQVILKILIQEKEPRWIGLRLGLAFEQQSSAGNKIEFTTQGGHRNLYGTARTLSLHLTPAVTYDVDKTKLSNPEYKVALMYVEPWIANTRTPGIFRLAYEQYRPLYSGNFDLFSASFDVQRKYSQDSQISGSLAARLVDQLSEKAIDSTLVSNIDFGKSQIYSFTLYAKRDKRKNLFNPSNGSFLDLSMAFSYSIGRDKNDRLINNQYITLISSWQRYQPFRPKVLSFKRWNFTLASRLKLGGIFETGRKQAIPINDLFFAGGSSTVRGYQEQLLGPAALKNADGKIKKAAGGKLLYLGNIEVRMPVYWIFVLETFFDSGYVWPEVSAFRPVDVKFTSGVGLAAITPLGPIRVDYGYKLIRTDSDPTPDAFHFGIYFAF